MLTYQTVALLVKFFVRRLGPLLKRASSGLLRMASPLELLASQIAIRRVHAEPVSSDFGACVVRSLCRRGLCPLGMIFVTLDGYSWPVCLVVHFNHTIDNVKAEIQTLWGIPPERQGLRFSYRGPQRRSRPRPINVLPNMYLVGHLFQGQLSGPHAPVVGQGWHIDCAVWDLGPRRIKISSKRPVFHNYYDQGDNRDNKRPKAQGTQLRIKISSA